MHLIEKQQYKSCDLYLCAQIILSVLAARCVEEQRLPQVCHTPSTSPENREDFTALWVETKELY